MSGILILELLLQFADVTRFLDSQTRADLASQTPRLLKHPQLAGEVAPWHRSEDPATVAYS